MLAKNLFGDDHEIEYDVIRNHDVYSYLRVILEVPRGQKEVAIVVLNGKEVGEVKVRKEGKKTLGYTARRYDVPGNNLRWHTVGTEFKQLGLAVASIISTFVK